MMPKSIVRGLLLVTLSMLILTACQPKETEDASTPTEPALPQQTDAPSETKNATLIDRGIFLDPAKTEDPDSLLVSRNLYEGLVKLDDNGEIQPGIAQSWEVSDDQLDYIFEIRPDARFSDGSAVTTDVIADNFNRWFDPQSAFHGDGNYPTWLKIFLAFNGERDAEDRAVSQVDGVQKVDNNTFIIHLNRPEPELLNYIAQPAFAILSPTALTNSNYGTRESTIISSGPYVITSWTDEELVLSPNPSYWDATEGEDMNFAWK